MIGIENMPDQQLRSQEEKVLVLVLAGSIFQLLAA
jgi:hypothetical protein